MALSKKLLSQDEVVVRHMHTHLKTLLPAIVVEILLVLAAAVGSFYVPQDARYWALTT
ncbi:MAG: PH domain-containing protein, partial [Actinomyces sp.]|nr:PH domain-containing protein [Actinomyces sp.]